jgi:hypothetical protein
MAEQIEKGTTRTVLLASTINSPMASRIAIRFSQAGCRVAAIYPSTKHLLGCTDSVASRHQYSMVHPIDSLLGALRASGAQIVVPCDGLCVRHLHALYAAIPATEEGAAAAEIIERSLGDGTAYLLLDSRHEVQTAARSDGINAAESFAIGSTIDPESLADAVPFPWVLKADYSWDGASGRVVNDLREARQFIRRSGAPPPLSKVLRQMVVKGDRAAMGEWLHAQRPSLSLQRPVRGCAANLAAACWKGDVLGSISVEVLDTIPGAAQPAKVRLIENEHMTLTARRMTRRLGLSGFHDFEFVLEQESGQPWLTGLNSHCAPPAHLNAGRDRDPVEAFCVRWLGAPAAAPAQIHAAPVIAYFPQAWIADPNDPILDSAAYDLPREDPRLIKCAMELARRERRFSAHRSREQRSGKTAG